MERLTDVHWRNLDPWECCGQNYYCQRGCHVPGGCTGGCIVPKIYDRLAVIEDILGDEYDIDHLRGLFQAKQDGRLVVLPCKVGDTVWTNFFMSGWYLREKNRPYRAKVVFAGLNDVESMGCGLFNVVYEERGHMMQFDFSELGKTVFLTREEAEAALEAQKGDAQ